MRLEKESGSRGPKTGVSSFEMGHGVEIEHKQATLGEGGREAGSQ